MQMKQIPLGDVKQREDSQRKEAKGVKELVESIRTIGLINPIVLDEDDRLIAGGNRLEAYKQLREEEGEAFAKIPCTYVTQLNSAEKKIVELDENLKRKDLTWQETAKAVVSIYELTCELNPGKTSDEIHKLMGMSAPWVHQSLTIVKAFRANNERVLKAETRKAALSIIEREKRRAADNESNEIWAALNEQMGEEGEEVELTEGDSPKPIALKNKVNPSEDSKHKIIHRDFVKWAEGYRGPQFNLLHCDFPYGINHGKSDQGGAKDWGAYEDSPDTYWNLLRALAEHRDRLLYPSAHILFWFSMRFYTETLAFFNKHMPEMEVDHQPLIWHKTDNKGITRDYRYTPRNITETALIITRGKREVIKNVANCYGAPTQKSSATHISEKPVPVLRHFFQLFCDEHSEVLDPTCGSGSSIRAAMSMKAKRTLGIELNEEYALDAKNQLEEAARMERLSEIVD